MKRIKMIQLKKSALWLFVLAFLTLTPVFVMAAVHVDSNTDPLAGEGNGDLAIFTVRLDSPELSVVTVNYTVAGTADSGVDFQPLSGHVDIPLGQTNATISVQGIADAIIEPGETVEITLTGSVPVIPLGADSTAAVTIVDTQTGTVSVNVTDSTVDEGGGNTGEFEVSLDIPSATDTTVSFTLDSSTALEGSDFSVNPPGASVVVPANATSAQIVITGLADSIIEEDETVEITLTGTDNPAITVNSSPATATLSDAQSGVVTITASSPVAGESGSPVGQFTVFLRDSGGNAITSSSDTQLNGNLLNDSQPGHATIGADFDLTTNIILPAGESSVTVDVPILEDTIVEGPEEIEIQLSSTNNPKITVGSPDIAVVTIEEDTSDTAQISLTNGDGWEGESIVFTATLDNEVAGGFTVQVDLVGNTATSGIDFNATTVPATLSFTGTPGEQVTFSATTIDDTLLEGEETFTVSLLNISTNGTPSAAIDISATSTGAIEDNDYVIDIHAGDDGHVTTSAGGGATAPPDTSVIVSRNDQPVFVIEPDDTACYHIEDVVAEGASQGSISSYTFTPVTQNESISATFAINQYTITVNVLEQSHGTVSESSATVNCNEAHTIDIQADTGYVISRLRLDGVDVTAAYNAKTFTLDLSPVQGDHTVEVAFSQLIEVIEVSPFGTINPVGSGTPAVEPVDYEGILNFDISSHADVNNPLSHNGHEHHISDVLIDGVSVGDAQGQSLTNYTYVFNNVIHNHSIEALFTSYIDVTIDGLGSVSTSDGFSLTNTGGVTVDDSYEVESGASPVLNIEPAEGYHVVRLDVDGETRGYASLWNFTEVVDEDHSLHVWFEPNAYTLDPVANFQTIFSDSSLSTPATELTPLYHQNGTFFVKLTEPNNYDYTIVVAGILIDNVEYAIPAAFDTGVTYPSTDPYFKVTRREHNSPSDVDYMEYLEIEFTNVEHSHRLEVLDYDGTPLANVPLDTRIQPQPATIMFVLDDSGSMDWEFITEDGGGLYHGRYYMWPTADRLYSGHLLTNAEKLVWKNQWAGYNKMFYNPSVNYTPWPTFYGHNLEDCDNDLTDRVANACLVKPRSHPWYNEGDTNKINMNATWADLSSGGGATYVTVFSLDEEHELVNQGDTYTYTITVNNDNSRISFWTEYTADRVDTMARILDSSDGEYRSNEYNDPEDWDGVRWDDDSGTNWNASITLDNVSSGTYKLRIRGYHDQPTGTFDFHVRVDELQTPDKVIVNAHYFSKDNSGNVYLTNIKDPVEYYSVASSVGEDGSISGSTLTRITDLSTIPPEVTYYSPTGAGTPHDVYTAERQNFVNWFSYYRKRSLAAVSAVATFIQRVDNVLLGFNSINHELVMSPRPIEVVEELQLKNERKSILMDLYTQPRVAHGTPLRSGLQQVGQFYDADDHINGINPPGNDPVVSPFANNVDGDECKQVFSIVMTDGYWNGGDPAGISDEDNDGAYRTLADVAEKYYSTDMASSVADEVPDEGNHAQHMITYTVAFGVKGYLNPETDTAPARDSSDWRQGNYYQDKIDDLWHAAVNGRGKFFSASRPDKLVNSLLYILEDIMGGRIGSGASVAINGDEFFQVIDQQVRMYQSSYNSDYWSGDIRSFSFDVDSDSNFTGERSLQWSAQNKLSSVMGTDGNGHTHRNIVTYDWGTNSAGSVSGVQGLSFAYADLTNEQQLLLTPYYNRDRSAADVLNFLRGSRTHVAVDDFRERLTKKLTWDHDNQIISYSTEEEAWLGDFVNSRPLFADSLVYAGANDGMLHAFKASGTNQGKEIFAYVPNLLFENLRELPKPDYRHLFFVDGKMATEKIDNLNNHHTYLVAGLGKGGKGYYSLDITNAKNVADSADAAALINWEYPPPVESNLILSGNTFSFEKGTGAGGNDRILDTGTGLDVFQVGNYIRVIGSLDSTRELTNDGTYLITAVAADGSTIDIATSGQFVGGIGNFQDIIIRKSTSDPDMGYSYGTPVIARSNKIKATHSGSIDYVYIAILANGYSSETGTASLKIVDLVSGKLIRTLDTGVGPLNGLSSPAAIDVNNDLRVDYVYAGDLRGNMWKFDLTSEDSDKWQVAFCQGGDSTDHCLANGAVPQPLFTAGAHQAITAAPDVMLHQTHTGYMVVFGTGKYLGMADLDNLDTQSVYGIWDWAPDSFDTGYLGARIDNTTVTPPVAELSNWTLTDVGGNMVNTLLRQEMWCEGNLTVGSVSGYFRVPSNYKGKWDLVYSNHLPAGHHVHGEQVDVDGDGTAEFFLVPEANLGWYFDLPGKLTDNTANNNAQFVCCDFERKSSDITSDLYKEWQCQNPIPASGGRDLGERVTSDSIIRNSRAITVSFMREGNRCSGGLYSFLNERDANNGGMGFDPVIDVNGDGRINSDDNVSDPQSIIESTLIVTDVGNSGHLNNPVIMLNNDGDGSGGPGGAGTETKYMSSSTERIEKIDETAEAQGFYFWKEVK
jgi:hypothetical protein